MKKGKFQNGTHFRGGKVIAALLAVVLLVGATIGGTIAWLTASTEKVENTFTVGNIDIALTETTEDYKMIPGYTIDKDPVVTVEAGSEACLVFVKVEEDGFCSVQEEESMPVEHKFDSFLEYGIAAGWTRLEKDVNGADIDELIFYREQPALTAEGAEDAAYYVLACKEDPADPECTGCVKVKDTVTKEMMDALSNNDATAPKLTFTAYAVQLYKSNGVEFTPADAWAQVKPAKQEG